MCSPLSAVAHRMRYRLSRRSLRPQVRVFVGVCLAIEHVYESAILEEEGVVLGTNRHRVRFAVNRLSLMY